MNTDKDYYKILGVSENATINEIKKAYRRLAKEFHPDRQGGNKSSEERFKEISEAYSVLSDPQKRQQYDMLRKNPLFRQEGFNFQNGNFGGVQFNFKGKGFTNIEDILSHFFRFGEGTGSQTSFFGSDMGFENSTRSSNNHSHRGSDLEANITISFELAANGGETIISTGVGKRIKIKIPPGIEQGKRIRIRGQGAKSSSGRTAGDLYIRINIAPHPDFERKGKDIYTIRTINIAQAILGTDLQITTVSGKKVKLKIPPGTNSGKVFRLPEMGIQSRNGKGDHYVKIQIEVPRNLTSSQANEFKSWAKKLGLV